MKAEGAQCRGTLGLGKWWANWGTEEFDTQHSLFCLTVT